MRRHWRELGGWPRPFRPRRFNDWIYRRMLLAPEPLHAQLCCKLGQRAYKAERIGEAPSLPLLGVWDHAGALAHDWARLPDAFMLKPTHGSSWYRAVRAKAGADRAATLAEAAAWLRLDYHRASHEIGYRDAVPRLIAEPLLPGPEGLLAPMEYQLFAFDGRVALAMSRALPVAGPKEVAFLDAAGRRLAVRKRERGVCRRPPPPAATWARMCGMAARLSRGVDFIRCDFLLVGDRLWPTELTPYPDGGRGVLEPDDWNLWLGGVWAATRAGRPWPDPPAGPDGD